MTNTAIKAQEMKIEKEGQNKKLVGDIAKGAVSTIIGAAIPKPAAKAAGDAMRTSYNIIRNFQPRVRSNNPAWYKKYITTNVNTNLPSFERLGLLGSGFITNASDVKQSVPGLLIYRYINWYMSGSDYNTYQYQNNALNDGFKRFMSQLRKHNSRTGSYEPADIGLYLIAATDILEKLVYLHKVIQCYNRYKAESVYAAKQLITAFGFDYDDFKANKANYEDWLTAKITKFNNDVILPFGLTYTQRKSWLASIVARDHDNDRAPLISFRPAHFWILDNVGGYLLAQDFNDNTTYSTWTVTLDSMFTNLVDNGSFQTMISDMRAGIDQSKFWKLGVPNFDEELAVNSDLETMTQIHNMTTAPKRCVYDFGGLVNMELHSDANGYLWQGSVDANNLPDTRSFLTAPIPSVGSELTTLVAKMNEGLREVKFNFYHDDISGDDILEASRLKATFEADGQSGTGNDVIYFVPTTCGTEIILKGDLYSMNNNDTLARSYFGTNNIFCNGDPSLGMNFQLARELTLNWLPIQKFYNADPNNLSANRYLFGQTAPGQYTEIGELDYYFASSEKNLERLNTQALLSMLFLEDSDFARLKY